MNFLLRFLFSISVCAALLSPAHSHDYQTGDLVIGHPVIPATVKSAPVAAGYLKITNSGEKDDRLLSVTTRFSDKSSIHEMKMVDGVMRMRPLSGGLVIPAGQSVVLKKGAEHLMFMKLQEQMKVGQLRKVTLVFEHAGTVEVEMLVVDPADLANGDKEEMDHSTHSSGSD